MRDTRECGVRGMRTKSSGWLVAVSMALIMGTVSPSFAQDAASGSQGSATSGGQGSVASSGPEVSPTGEYKEGLALGGWMFSPEIFLGAVYNSNAINWSMELKIMGPVYGSRRASSGSMMVECTRRLPTG